MKWIWMEYGLSSIKKPSFHPYSLFDETLLEGSGGNSRKKKKIGLLDLGPPPRFDLVIVDEAHHIRNPENANHKAVLYSHNKTDSKFWSQFWSQKSQYLCKNRHWSQWGQTKKALAISH